MPKVDDPLGQADAQNPQPGGQLAPLLDVAALLVSLIPGAGTVVAAAQFAAFARGFHDQKRETARAEALAKLAGSARLLRSSKYGSKPSNNERRDQPQKRPLSLPSNARATQRIWERQGCTVALSEEQLLSRLPIGRRPPNSSATSSSSPSPTSSR